MAVSKVILNGETLIDVTQKTVAPSNMLSGITALKNDGTNITGSIAAKSAADLITSGSQVTVPSGMYAAAATTAIASGSVKFFDSDLNLTPVFTLNTATGVVSASSQKGIESIPLVTPGYVSNADSHFVMGSASGSYQLPIHGNLTASGSIVTAPSGWYGTAASTAVEAGWISLALGSTEISIDSGRFNIDDQTGIIYVNDGVTLTQVPPFIPGYISDVGHLELDVEATGSYQLPVKTASDLWAAGSVVTVPSGYYIADVSKAVASGSINLNFDTQVSLDSYSFNINPDTGVVYVDGGVISTGRPGFSSGYISDPGYYMIEASASGSYALPTQAAATIIPSTADQVVASGYFLTGAQTIKGDSALIPSNIAAGVSIFGIEGTHQGGGNYQAKTVSPTGETQVVLPDNAEILNLAVGDTAFTFAYGEGAIPVPGAIVGKTYHIEGKLGADMLVMIDGQPTQPEIAINGDVLFDGSTVDLRPITTITVTTWWGDGIRWKPNKDIFVEISATWDVAVKVLEEFTVTEVGVTSYDALSSVTVEAAALQSKVITPSAISQIISADSSYYGLSQVIVEPIATTSYYLAQDSQGYITYSSIMPSGGEYYIFDVAGIKHIEPPIEYKIFTQENLVLDTAVTGAGDTYYIEDTPATATYSFNPKLNEGAHYRITRNNTEYTGVIAKTSSGDYTWAEIGNDFNDWDSSFPFGVRIYSLNPSSQQYLVYIGESTSGTYAYKIELEDSGV